MSDHRPYRRRPQPEIIGLRTSELGRPLDLGPGDDRYVDHCLERGGFASFVRHAGRILFGHGGRVWMQP